MKCTVNPRKSYLWSCYASVLAAAFLLSHCGHETTTFDEKRQTTKIDMEVGGEAGADATAADAAAAAAPAELPDASDVTSVFDSLDNGSLPGTSQAGITESSGASAGTEPLGSLPSSGQPGGEPLGPISGTSGGGSTQAPSSDELSACAQLQGVAADKIMITGNQPNVQITQNAVAAIKLAGNQPRLELTLTGSETARIAGLCVFLAGNQAEAQLNLYIPVGRIVYIGRGNQSHGDILVRQSLDFLAVDLAGDQASLHVSGSGTHPCPAARLKGHDAHFDCE